VSLIGWFALCLWGASVTLTTPQGWQVVEIESGIRFAVPPDAQRVGGIAVDSTAGLFDGTGYRITFDLGPFGERLEFLEGERSFQARSRRIAGRPAREATFMPSDEPFAWARVLHVDVDVSRTLTLRVSCDSTERCRLADRVFDSVEITP
jgi:hypothetical protein